MFGLEKVILKAIIKKAERRRNKIENSMEMVPLVNFTENFAKNEKRQFLIQSDFDTII